MRVVDLSCDVAGRFAAKLFAMAGVEVVRPVVGEPGRSALDLYLDAHKAITPIEPGSLAALAAGADLIFTSFDRGAWTGLAGAPFKAPATCVQVTTSTFGTTGPYAALRGGPLAEWAAGGYFGITGWPDREPLIGPERLCGYVGGYTAAIAAEAALEARRRSGRGQFVDISVMEAMLGVHQSTFARMAAGLGRVRTGRYTEVYPLVVRPCKDGFVSLGVVTDVEFDKLVLALDRPELAADERFIDGAARWANRDALDAELAGVLEAYTADELTERLQAGAVVAAKVVGTREVLANPQLAWRGFWERPSGPAGPVAPGNPVPAAEVFAKTPAPARAVAKAAALPLDGVLVLDFTAFWAGPSATRNLADLGATVVKIERPGSRIDLDDRLADPSVVVPHLYHVKMNRKKFSVTASLDKAEDLAAVRRLAARADVVIENFRPGVADKLGIGAPALCAENPALVYVSLSGFGARGPWSEWRSYGPTIEAASSIEGRTGYAGGEPLRLGHTLPDGIGGLVGSLAALRGLREREARGVGGWYDVSQLEAYVALSGEDILAASAPPCDLALIGNRSRSGAIQGAFPCRGDDAWIAIRLDGEGDVTAFAEVADLPGLPNAAAAVPRDDDAIEAMIADFTRPFEKRELAERLQAAGLEAAPVFMPQDLVDDPHLRARGFFVIAHFDGRTAPLPGTPFRGTPPLADPEGDPPRFGEHTARFLKP